MKTPFTLNGAAVTAEAEGDARLLDALRALGCTDVKRGCGRGACGACMVLLDGAAVPSCSVFLAAARDCEVITLNHFKMRREYRDIARDIEAGFAHAGAALCGYCDAGKIFAAYNLLTRNERLTRDELLAELASLECRCADASALADGTAHAALLREKRSKAQEKAKPKEAPHGGK